MVINTSRTLAVSERDPSLEPGPVTMNTTSKNIQLTYHQSMATSGQKFTQQIRKSRAGREPGKNPNASMEPKLNGGANASVNLINSPANWGKQTKNGSFIQSPMIGSQYGPPQERLNLSLREQLYQVKNSVHKQLQFNGQQRAAAMQSPRLINATEKQTPIMVDGPT